MASKSLRVCVYFVCGAFSRMMNKKEAYKTLVSTLDRLYFLW